ncbi:MAG: zf-TFIIB domain-containing protein [Pseudomonadota bacterium]
MEDEREKPLECPRCEMPLEARLLADTLVDQCTDCGGVFLDHDVLGALLNDRKRQAPLRERLLKLPKAGPAPNPREVVYLRCPECSTLMTRRNPAHRSGIIVDVCTAHGVWFDDRELAILMQLASAGAELNVLPKPNPLAGVSSKDAAAKRSSLPRMPDKAMGAPQGPIDIDVNIGDLGDLLRVIDRLF